MRTCGIGLICLYLAATIAAEFPDCLNGELKDSVVCDTSLDPSTRAEGLVRLMTVNEKMENVQNAAPGVSRLGIPPYEWWNEALHGVSECPGVDYAEWGEFSYGTSFPQPILLGASFDDKLIFDIATVTSTEARAYSNAGRAGLDFWTPNINPFKDPRWGRGQETPGEDVLHLQRYVYNIISGYQGDNGNKYKKIVATCKHFVAYDLEDWGGNDRFGFEATISTQDLSEYYLPPFRSCARDARAGAVMCSYNSVNGVPVCANEYLMQTILRDHWKWSDEQQWVVSDCDAVGNIFDSHGYAKTAEEGAAYALNAGCDLDCGNADETHNNTYAAGLPIAFERGLFAEEVLDHALIRLYSSLVRTGYFDPASEQPYRSISWSDVGTIDAEKLARRAAVEGIVLLKNEEMKALPLTPKSQTVAVIGPLANATHQMKGNYEGPSKFVHSPLWAAQQLPWNVVYAKGTTLDAEIDDETDKALTVAKSSDIIIYVGGIDNSIEREGHDRNSIAWPENQKDLIEKLGKVGKTLIVVQMGGGQLDDSDLLSNPSVKALLWAGYPGQDGGSAIFDVITGREAPAGRLPITQYPVNYVDEVPMTDMSLRPSKSNPGRTYRWYDNAVLEFGYGLHYTNFSLSWVINGSHKVYDTKSVISTAKYKDFIDTALFDSFKILVENTGSIKSDYVALLFLSSDDAGPKPYPRKTLVSYMRLHDILPGEVRVATLDVPLSAVARTNKKGDLILFPGRYHLHTDYNGGGIGTLDFKIKGEEVVLDHFPQPPNDATWLGNFREASQDYLKLDL